MNILKTMLLVCLFGVLFSSQSVAMNVFEGEKLYKLHCVSCHGENGKSKLIGVPDFSRGERLLQTDQQMINTLKSGKGIMPSYNGILDKQELLGIIAYIRTLF